MVVEGITLIEDLERCIKLNVLNVAKSVKCLLSQQKVEKFCVRNVF